MEGSNHEPQRRPMRSLLLIGSIIFLIYLLSRLFDHPQPTERPQIQPWDGIRPLFPPPPWAGECRWTKVTIPDKEISPYPMCVMTEKDLISEAILEKGNWDDCNQLLLMWKKSLLDHPSSNPVFVDIGANIGACSLLMLAAGVRVIAFEPVPDNQYYFSRSILNSNWRDKIQLYPVGCGADYSEHDIFLAPGNFGGTRLNAPFRNGKNITRKITIVPCQDLLWSDRSQPPPQIPLLKIDVEGLEVAAMNGLKELILSGAVKAIKSEIGILLRYQKTSASEYCRLLKELGFELFDAHTNATLSDAVCRSYDKSDKITDLVGYWKG